MTNRLWTTSALAVVVMMLVGACASSTASPTPPRPSRQASPPARRPSRPRRAPSAEPSAPPAAAVPAVPTGYTELDAALGADKPFNGKTVSVQTQWIGGEGTNFAASLADFAAATGIKIKVDSIGSSHETVLRTRIEGGQPPDLAMLAQPTPVLAYAADGKVIDVATFMDPKKLSRRAPGHHRPGHRGQQHLGHPVQGRRQVDHLVPDQGLRGRGLHRSHDVGRADRPVRQDRRRRHQPVVRQRGRSRRRDRLADHRLGRGSGPQDQGPRLLQPVDQPRDPVQRPGDQGSIRHASARSSSRTSYVYGGPQAIINTDQKTPMDPMFDQDLAAPEVLDAEDPDLVRPGLLPGSARKRRRRRST